MNTDKKDNLSYDLTWTMLIGLLVFYFLNLFAGIPILVYVLCFYDMENNIMLYTVIASISGALATCSMQYIKRIYKACIYKRVNIIHKSDSLKCIGNFIYFLGRPLFAVIFVLIFIFGMKAGMILVLENNKFEVNDRFLYVCTFISCMIGFSVGKVLDIFQEVSLDKLKRICGEETHE